MTITVSQLNNYIRGLIDLDGVLSDVSVCGEVTNLKKSRDGWYFSLKDDQASVNCFCYDNTATPEIGAVVVAEGQISFFAKNGSLSMFIRRLSSTSNVGAAYLRFAELKEKLKKEGLFDEERKRSVPHCCNKIGVVTSETGAVIHDITNVALRRQPFVDVVLYPVKVQGEGAAGEIAQGIAYFASTDVDVVIVGRGGGSNEDLSVFNDETVVRAVANSAKPVVSAVGHGVDFTLCDFAADKRAVTPSEAAEFVTIDAGNTKNAIRANMSRIEAIISGEMLRRCEKVACTLKNINSSTLISFEQSKSRVEGILTRASDDMERLTNSREHSLKECVAKLNTLSPLSILQRGYAYIERDERVIKSVDDVKKSDELTLTVSDGKIITQVLAKEKK